MIKLNLQVLYSGLTMVHTLIVLYIYIYIYISITKRDSCVVITVDRYFFLFPRYSTALNIRKNFHTLSSFNVNETGSH